MNPRDPALAHDFNVVLVHSRGETDEVSHGLIDENYEAYIASLLQRVQPFYVAPDFVHAGAVSDAE